MQVTLRKMEIAGRFFQIVMAQQNLNGVQVGAGFQHVRGEAVPEHVGIYLFLNPGTAGGVLAGVTRRFRIQGLIPTMPTVSGEEPNGFFAQAPPVCTEFLEQNGAEHHVAVFATLAALDVNHHPSAVNVADLQSSQLRVANTGGVKGHQDSSMKRCAGCIDDLGHFFLAEYRGQAMGLLRIRSIRDTPRSFQRLDVEKPQGTQVVRHRTG